MQSKEISLVFPVYNEEKNLKKSVQKTKSFLETSGYNYEIIISDDGSIDQTKKIAEKLSLENPEIKYLPSEINRGKGGAIKDAFTQAKGDILIFLDIDLSADISYLPKLINEIKNGADISIGSRFLPLSKVRRSCFREILSRGYIYLAKLLFKTKITDFQCGFKAFSRKILPMIVKTKTEGWFWDTEILLTAERFKMKIVQTPIRWEEGKKSKYNLIKSTISMLSNLGYNLIKLKIKFSLS